MADAVGGLALRSFGVAFGDHVVLAELTIELPPQGMTVLVGPAGAGKSTLARTLASLNDSHPSLVTWGAASFDGRALDTHTRPTLVGQHARFFLDSVRENLVSALQNRSELTQRHQMQIICARLEAAGLGALCDHLERNAVELSLSLQRRLAIGRALIREPAMLVADEPTVGLPEPDALALVELLRRQARRRAVMLITHHQRFAAAAGGTTLLLAGGRFQHHAPTGEFFSRPRSELARHFVRTGGCPTPVLGVSTLPAAHTAGPHAPAQPVPSQYVGPRGFYWILPGRLGGMPRPGLVDDLAHDLAGLRRLAVTTLVTLEETQTVSPDAAAAVGVRTVHFPIPDMGVPEVTSAIALCGQIARCLDRGEVVAVHCRAGMGRTGTLLACQLIAAGQPPHAALDVVRSINPRCVQSTVQVDFLRSFATARGATAAAPRVDDGQHSRGLRRR